MTLSTMTRESAGGTVRTLWIVGCIICMVIGVAIGYFADRVQHGFTAFSTQYQAVLLSNGAVYYGKLAGYGSPHPMLTDTFYILSKTDPNTKETTNILVKRGKELHEPDRMYLNANQIIFVEPVGTTSKVAHLITEASR